MTCILYNFLTRQLEFARLRSETHEVKRLTANIEAHKNTCVVCAGIDQNFLVSKFFEGLQIVVLK